MTEISIDKFFNAAPLAMVLIRIDILKTLSINRRASELFSIKDSEDGLSNLNKHINPTAQQEFLEKIKEGGFVESYETTLTTDYGESFWAMMTGQLVEVDGYPCVLVGIIDITNKKENEENLTKTKEEALLATQTKSMFLATMSHEIRTPMNGVLGMIDLLSRSTLNKDQREIVDVIKQSAVSLLTIIDDILDLSKIEAGKLEIENIPVSLTQLIEISIDLISARLTENNLEIAWIKESNLPKYILGDSTRLRQILLNLLSNAVKFTKAGTIIIKVKNIGEKIRFEVSDTGIGIKKDHIQKLFNEYVQADISTTRQFGGTGLGLQICKRLTNMMGGDIGVNSVYNKGSTFWFDIPLHPVIDQKQGNELEGLTILVIDSFYESQKSICNILTDAKANIIELENENWEELLKYKFDIALIDKQNIIKNLDKIENIIDKKLIIPTITSNLTNSILWADVEGFQKPIKKPARTSKYLKSIANVISNEKILMQVDYTEEDEKIIQLSDVILPNLLDVEILVAEDDSVNRIVIYKQLKELNYTFDITSDGISALELFNKKKYKLVLTDCSMPNMNGFDLTKEIRSKELQDSIERTPIVALTANVTKGEFETCLAAGMDDYLSKPVLLDKLLATLEKWIPSDNPINLEKFANIFGPAYHSQATIKEFLTFFCDTFSQNITEMSKAHTSKNIELLSNLAHKAKGSANNACTEKMHIYLQDLEKSLDYTKSKILLNIIEKEFEKIKTFVDIL